MRADLKKAEKDPLNHIVFLLGDFNVQLNCSDVVPLAGACGAKAGVKGEHVLDAKLKALLGAFIAVEHRCTTHFLINLTLKLNLIMCWWGVRLGWCKNFFLRAGGHQTFYHVSQKAE
eukprot:2308962-Karenia_brevis.AAC.1